MFSGLHVQYMFRASLSETSISQCPTGPPVVAPVLRRHAAAATSCTFAIGRDRQKPRWNVDLYALLHWISDKKGLFWWWVIQSPCVCLACNEFQSTMVSKSHIYMVQRRPPPPPPPCGWVMVPPPPPVVVGLWWGSACF